MRHFTRLQDVLVSCMRELNTAQLPDARAAVGAWPLLSVRLADTACNQLSIVQVCTALHFFLLGGWPLAGNPYIGLHCMHSTS